MTLVALVDSLDHAEFVRVLTMLRVRTYADNLADLVALGYVPEGGVLGYMLERDRIVAFYK